jgi:thiol-disulfide isomerase/thioredoxin
MTKTTQTSNKSQTDSRFPTKYIWWGVGGLAGLALIVWMAWAIASETEVDESVAFGEVTVQGEALPTVDLTNGDPAVGQEAPTISATDLDGNSVTIGPDGRAKIVVLLAHWCPHCQDEVPVLQSWVESGGLPEDVDLYAATVLTNRLRDSSTWPPSEWLESEGWAVTTLKDDQNQTIASSYGLTGTPYYIVLDGENNNLGRISGALGVQGFEAMASIAQAGLEG